MRTLSSAAGNNIGGEFLDFLLVELLWTRSVRASDVYIISPWITNPRFGTGQRRYYHDVLPHTSEPDALALLQALVDSNAHLHIAVREPQNPRNPTPTEADTQKLLAVLQPRCAGQVTIRSVSQLHAKLYAGELMALSGSLNLTRAGLTTNVELMSVITDPDEVREHRLHAQMIMSLGRDDSCQMGSR